jgi:tight adherence protein C
MDVLATLDIPREWVFLAVLMLAVTILVFGIGFMFVGAKSALDRRVHNLASPEQKQEKSKVIDTLESLAPSYVPRSEKEQQSVRLKLMHAGFHHKNAIANFYALKMLSFTIGAVLAAVVFVLSSNGSQSILYAALLVFIGLFAPNFILARIASKRQRRIRAGIPDTLDLLVVCTESGLGFLAAMKRVASETYISHPELADELETICAKVKAGVELPRAFDELVVRTGLSELKGLVSMLSHASRIGGSLSDTLRDYNEDYRDRRNQAAEEIAAKIPTKMLFPMLLFIWPCFFIVAIGPAVITIVSAFE